MPDPQFGPFQRAVNKMKQYAIDNGVPSAASIKLDGLLGDDWDAALEEIIADSRLRGTFDYRTIREIRDDPELDMIWCRFVGGLGDGGFPGHRQFLKFIGERAREEAQGTKPVSRRILWNRVCGSPDYF